VIANNSCCAVELGNTLLMPPDATLPLAARAAVEGFPAKIVR